MGRRARQRPGNGPEGEADGGVCGIMELQNGQFDFGEQLGPRFERPEVAGAALYHFLRFDGSLCQFHDVESKNKVETCMRCFTGPVFCFFEWF